MIDKKIFRDTLIVSFQLESFAIKVENRKQGPWIYAYINGIKCLVCENAYDNIPKRLYTDFIHGSKEIMLEIYLEDDMKYPSKTYYFKARVEKGWVYFEAFDWKKAQETKAE